MTDLLATIAIVAALVALFALAYKAGQLNIETRIMHGGDDYIDNLVDAYADDARRRVGKRMGLDHD